MRTDIKKLVNAKEYTLASRLLNTIAKRLHNEIYLTERPLFNVIYYYQDYTKFLLKCDIPKKGKRIYTEKSASIFFPRFLKK